MSAMHPFYHDLRRSANFSGLMYVAAVVALCLTIVLILTDIIQQYHARNASLEVLSRLVERNHLLSTARSGTAQSWPSGSPFLNGQTVTVASAALLQRVTSIITNVGGTVVSSEIERQGERSKDGQITAIANCDLEQSDLQRALYELEAGMPFLFVVQLAVEGPASANGERRLHVQLGVSGLFPGTK
jgi:general secretion pathway protein M